MLSSRPSTAQLTFSHTNNNRKPNVKPLGEQPARETSWFPEWVGLPEGFVN
eukprot:gnl/Chilomastix_caulleri/6024.p1 GENE.gnl/Chilomastix_caulleri/6024~~gnl/Chilomastix_caulleri/6024.p1  ORF type:complete len:51 (+),score=0.52 gnl/Chilomastix_caulleri/6024:214-366(+)